MEKMTNSILFWDVVCTKKVNEPMGYIAKLLAPAFEKKIYKINNNSDINHKSQYLSTSHDSASFLWKDTLLWLILVDIKWIVAQKL